MFTKISNKQKMNSVLWRPLMPTAMLLLITLFCAGYLISPLHAFSARGVSSHRSISSTRTYAVFEDDDCEDLCGAFGEDSPAASLEVDTSTSGRVKTNSYTPPRLSRGSRALWWTESGTEKCKSCKGSGEQTCRFCGGTDFLSAIGGETDALFYEGIGKDCPVCNDGVETCQKCAGTGFLWVASWGQERNRTDSLHP